MSSCSAPIYDGDKFIGCVTVDMELTNISEMVSNIKIGSTGRAILLSSDGTYIYTDDNEKVQNGVKMQEDPDANVAAGGQMILANSSENPGMGVMQENGKTILLTYMNIPDVNWKMIIRMDITELEAPVKKATTALTTIMVIALVVSAAIIMIFVMSISKSISGIHLRDFSRMNPDSGRPKKVAPLPPSLLFNFNIFLGLIFFD